MFSKKRKENKKNKLAALAKVIHLNDKERTVELPPTMSMESVQEVDVSQHSKKRKNHNVEQNIEETNDDGFSKVVCKKKRKNANKEAAEQSENNEQHNKESHEKFVLSDEQYKELQKQLKQRARELKVKPILHLSEMGRRALINTESELRTALFLTDIQNLLMYMLLQKKSPCKPERWCYVEHPESVTHACVLIVEGMSLYHYHAFQSKFANTQRIFSEIQLEIVLPPYSKGSIIKELLQVPLTMLQAPKLIEEHGSLDNAVELTKDPLQHVKAIFEIEQQKGAEEEETEVAELPKTDKFPRTKLLLSALQMVDEGYPIPFRGELSERYKNFKFTKDKYAPVTNKSPMFGVDCEMCFTAAKRSEVTRISIVDEDMNTIYESLVRPSTTILDYLTEYSGITAEMMLTATKTLKNVQEDIQQLLPPDAILVGQSLESDLNALMMMHPYVIDTGVCFNLTGVRRRKSKLKLLSETFLKEEIQLQEGGHDSVEDSKAALKLVQLKLANSVDFGDEILLRKKRFHEIVSSARETFKASNQAHPFKGDKNVSIVSLEKCLTKKLKCKLEKANKTASEDVANDSSKKPPEVHVHELSANKQVIKKAREIALDHALNLSNIAVDLKDLPPAEVEKVVEKVDKWINRIWRSVAANGIFIVVLGGSQECPSGLAQIAIKNVQHDAIVEEVSESDKE